jgi:hypothetical protein
MMSPLTIAIYWMGAGLAVPMVSMLRNSSRPCDAGPIWLPGTYGNPAPDEMTRSIRLAGAHPIQPLDMSTRLKTRSSAR